MLDVADVTDVTDVTDGVHGTDVAVDERRHHTLRAMLRLGGVDPGDSRAYLGWWRRLRGDFQKRAAWTLAHDLYLDRDTCLLRHYVRCVARGM